MARASRPSRCHRHRGALPLNGRHINDRRRQVHRHYSRTGINTYGLFVDYGTGRNTPRGHREALSSERNPGDIGKANGRKRKRWFSRKYFASVMNIQEFYADSLGQKLCRVISNALNPDIMRRAVIL